MGPQQEIREDTCTPPGKCKYNIFTEKSKSHAKILPPPTVTIESPLENVCGQWSFGTAQIFYYIRKNLDKLIINSTNKDSHSILTSLCWYLFWPVIVLPCLTSSASTVLDDLQIFLLLNAYGNVIDPSGQGSNNYNRRHRARNVKAGPWLKSIQQQIIKQFLVTNWLTITKIAYTNGCHNKGNNAIEDIASRNMIVLLFQDSNSRKHWNYCRPTYLLKSDIETMQPTNWTSTV